MRLYDFGGVGWLGVGGGVGVFLVGGDEDGDYFGVVGFGFGEEEVVGSA